MGNATSYSFNHNCQKLKIYTYNAPLDIKPYKKDNQKNIQRNYLIFKDYVLGASFIYEKKCF